MNIKIFFVAMVSFMVLDFVWFQLAMKGFYKAGLGNLMRQDTNWLAVILVYVLLALGVAIFLAPQLSSLSFLNAFLLGALFGVVVYGVYDLTNMAVIQGWSLRVTIIDMLWGGAATGIVSLIIKFIK